MLSKAGGFPLILWDVGREGAEERSKTSKTLKEDEDERKEVIEGEGGL